MSTPLPPSMHASPDRIELTPSGKSPKTRSGRTPKSSTERTGGPPIVDEEKLTEILRFNIPPDEVAYKRITENLRSLIVSKALPAGTRLLTLAKLAELWETNYFTVQTALTPLVNEGLLVRKQRTGTFVAESTPQIKAVGIFFGNNLWRIKHSGFYQALYAALCDHCEQQGIAVHLFMDTRPRGEQQKTPWPPLDEAIKRCEINAVIGSMLTREQSGWLDRLPLPVSLLASRGQGIKSLVSFGMNDFLRSSLLRLKARNCRSVALITAAQLPGAGSLPALAAELGMECREDWILQQDGWPEEYAEFGFESFGKIWSGKDKPDGLIVFPDNIALGVIMGVLKNGVRVPEDLKLVLHCNDEVYFHCPIPADWQVVSVVKIINVLWAHLETQAAGKKPRKISVNLTLRPSSPHSPPTLRNWSVKDPSNDNSNE